MNEHLLEFTTHHGELTKADHTGLQGSITCQYDRLVRVFGTPFFYHDGVPDWKTDAQWIIQFADGMIGTIYNWKNGVNYKGLLGKPVEQITSWNVGGHYAPVVPRIRELIAKDFIMEIDEIQGGLADEFDEFTKDQLNDFSEVKKDPIAPVEKKISRLYKTLDKMTEKWFPKTVK